MTETPPAAAPSPHAPPADATLRWQQQGDAESRLVLTGDGRDGGLRWPAAPSTGPLVVDGRGLTHFDSLLAARLWALARESGGRLRWEGLPAGLGEVLALAQAAEASPGAPPPAHGWLARVGLRLTESQGRLRVTLGFIGELIQALLRSLRGRSAMRAEDLMLQLHATGPASLPIVSLVSFLVGLIVAYMGAAQLQRLGAQIYIADLVTIGVVREIAALMTGIILAGRVGAAFAAQLGSMQANEEIDALASLGLPPMEHLVLPRVLAMVLMAPLLTLYAAIVGVAAGWLVAVGIYHVESAEYLVRSGQALTLTHLGIGLLKGTVYALLVALAGCRQGLNAGRSAQAVGDATTAAVVQSIVWMVLAASVLTIMFQRLGW
ncbi:MlaE family ABC transporter permease [Ideonella oryzae]|uniref:ABC transporter permease n=1 Tax=Ideonella oryzae TaxID=2937441 RepID=A0ABT1BJ06_9BURK|nr:ABC transporter permease [Ideonella oryzae]MCO5976200.1 ABC transporter permease [Ideonella oryzae]